MDGNRGSGGSRGLPPACAQAARSDCAASPIQMTWSRAGPTPTRRTGTPTKSAMYVEVVAGRARQVVSSRALADVLVEARQLLVLGLGVCRIDWW